MKSPPAMPFAYIVVNDIDELPDGGARRLRDRPVAPTLTPARVRTLTDTAPAAGTDWTGEYFSKFAKMNQGGEGACTSCAARPAEQWSVYRATGIAINRSWPFGYFADVMHTNPPGITGSMVSRTIHTATIQGVCTDAFWSQGSAFAPSLYEGVRRRPSPAAYADAATRKVLRWSYVPKDPVVWNQLLAAGFLLPYALANHAMCLIAVSADGYWYFGLDSERYDSGGIRAVNRDLLLANVWDMCVIENVAGGGIPVAPPDAAPPQGQQMAVANFQAKAAALIPGQITAQQLAEIDAARALIVPDAGPSSPPVTPPQPPVTPPAGASPDRTVIIAPNGTIVDPRGRTWSWGGPGTHGGGTLITLNGVSTGGEATKLAIKDNIVYCWSAAWGGAWFRVTDAAGALIWLKTGATPPFPGA